MGQAPSLTGVQKNETCRRPDVPGGRSVRLELPVAIHRILVIGYHSQSFFRLAIADYTL